MKNRHLVAALVCALFAIGLAAANTIGERRPVPRVHDEFSYLLGADTFRSGRLTNPPHAFPEFFASFHELQRPTYASKYPPGQALVIAAGWTMGGAPIVGVWLGFAAMAAALYWMLLAWVDERLAVVLTIGAAGWLAMTNWSHSFWGGAVALTGGALVYGATPRLLKRPQLDAAAALGVGLFVLANTRPFEGLLVSIPAMISISLRLSAREYGSPRTRLKLVTLLGVIGLAGGALMAKYNRAVTGSALTMPHLLYERTEESAPLFIWQPITLRTFDDPRRTAFQALALRRLDALRSNYVGVTSRRIGTAITFFIPAALLFPLVFLPLVKRDAPTNVAISGLLCVCGGIMASTWFFPHYVAPAGAPLLAIYGRCLAALAAWRGRWMLVANRVALATQAIWVAPPILLGLVTARTQVLGNRRYDWALARVALADSLPSDGKQHLLFVSYPSNVSPDQEWVFNGANIDGQSVVWAHDLGAGHDAELQHYFPHAVAGRVRVQVDSPFYRLEPLP